MVHGDAGRFPAERHPPPPHVHSHQRRLPLPVRGLNWVWFLHVNALARALGLNPFKDVFLAERAAEPYAEIEALLAALSTGPVGIGDRIGGADRDLVLRTCREDGVLVKPDLPLAALDHCFRAHRYLEPRLLLGETSSTHAAGRWVYVVAPHASRTREPIRQRVALAQLGALQPTGPVLAYDWRRGGWTRHQPDGGWEVELAWQDWDLRILCPLLPGERALFGDVGKYATVGDRRIAAVDASADELSFDCSARRTRRSRFTAARRRRRRRSRRRRSRRAAICGARSALLHGANGGVGRRATGAGSCGSTCAATSRCACGLHGDFSLHAAARNDAL